MIQSVQDLLSIAAQACINTYRGEYGEVNHDMFTISNSFDNNHVEWDMSWYDYETAVIAFRGSCGIEDWKDNAKITMVRVPYPAENKKIRIHRGFLEQYLKARPIIMHFVAGYTIKRINQVVITGHSLGGALATLCALDIACHYPAIHLVCVPLGSPRVGNRAFVQTYTKRVPETYRIIYGNDMVCKVPPAWMGYRHVNSPVFVGKKTGWWSILHPLQALFGNPLDHYPQNYLKGIME